MKTGHIVKRVVITVLLQPWASTMRVTSTIPVIPGGIGQGDLTKITVPGEQLTVRTESTLTSIRPTMPISGSVLQTRDQISSTIQPARTTSATTSTTSAASNTVRSDPVFISMRPATVSTVRSVSFAWKPWYFLYLFVFQVFFFFLWSFCEAQLSIKISRSKNFFIF